MKPHRDSCRDRASSWPTTKAQLGGHSISPQPACQQLGLSPAVREEISSLSSSPPPLARFHSCHWLQCLTDTAQPWSLRDQTQLWNCPFLRPGAGHSPHTHGPRWQLHMDSSTKTQGAGSSPSVCPADVEQETVATQLAQPSHCGMQWRMFLRKLEVLPCLTGGEAGQRTCLLSPSLLCWTPLLCTPSQYNEQLSLPSWQGNAKLSCLRAFSYCGNP